MHVGRINKITQRKNIPIGVKNITDPRTLILKRIAVNAISNRLISVQIQIHKTDTELLSLWLKMHFFYLLKISALEFSLIFGVVIDMEVILVLHPRGKLLVGGFFFNNNSGSWRPTGTLIIDLNFS